MKYEATYDDDLTSSQFNEEKIIDNKKMNIYANPVIFFDSKKTKIDAENFAVIKKGNCRKCNSKLLPYSEIYLKINPFMNSAWSYCFKNSYCEACAKAEALQSYKRISGDPAGIPEVEEVRRVNTACGSDLIYFKDGSYSGLPSVYGYPDFLKLRGASI